MTTINKNASGYMQTIFTAMDFIHSMLKNCGKRLKEARELFNISVFEHERSYFKMKYGVFWELLKENAYQSTNELILDIETIHPSFKVGTDILIYDDQEKIFELNSIEKIDDQFIHTSKQLANDYRKGAIIIALKTIEIKWLKDQQLLQKKIDNQPWENFLENVTDFQVTFYPETKSVLYRIELNQMEQLRGYVWLLNY